MKKILAQIFIALGVIFLILIIGGVGFFITDPYNLKPMLFGNGAVKVQPNNSADTAPTNKATTESTATTATGGFQLSDAQRQALISLGVDPAAVPSSISVEQETCFVSVLGEARVTEIKGGAVPNALEFFKAKSCI